jgi:hypothetical protein
MMQRHLCERKCSIHCPSLRRGRNLDSQVLQVFGAQLAWDLIFIRNEAEILSLIGGIVPIVMRDRTPIIFARSKSIDLS